MPWLSLFCIPQFASSSFHHRGTARPIAMLPQSGRPIRHGFVPELTMVRQPAKIRSKARVVGTGQVQPSPAPTHRWRTGICLAVGLITAISLAGWAYRKSSTHNQRPTRSGSERNRTSRPDATKMSMPTWYELADCGHRRRAIGSCGRSSRTLEANPMRPSLTSSGFPTTIRSGHARDSLPGGSSAGAIVFAWQRLPSASPNGSTPRSLKYTAS